MAKKAKREDFDPILFQGIAHRGLHDANKTENGLNAFKAALENGYAIELDIHLTKDNELLVCHDDNLKRTTGKEGIIEDLTLGEIRNGYRLLDGEVVPTFQEVLNLVQEKTPIVVELKVHQKNFRPLAKKAMEVLRSIQNKKRITLISFDPRALHCCRKSPFTRGLLVCKNSEWVFRLRGFFEYLDVEECLLITPKYQKERKKGRLLNVWTIHNENQLKEIRGQFDMITFQDLGTERIHEYLKEE
mgnify:FL=1